MRDPRPPARKEAVLVSITLLAPAIADMPPRRDARSPPRVRTQNDQEAIPTHEDRLAQMEVREAWQDGTEACPDGREARAGTNGSSFIPTCCCRVWLEILWPIMQLGLVWLFLVHPRPS